MAWFDECAKANVSVSDIQKKIAQIHKEQKETAKKLVNSGNVVQVKHATLGDLLHIQK